MRVSRDGWRVMVTLLSMPFVYLATNTVNGKTYVGKTMKTAALRWERHVAIARGGRRRGFHALHAAIAKHGADAFIVETIEVCASEDDAFSAERFWIEWYGSFGPNGYNLTAGGEGASGRSPSEAERARLSAANKGICRPARAHFEKLSRLYAGKRPSDATIAAVKAANTGRKHSAFVRDAKRAFMTGRKATDATKQKIADAALRRWARAAGIDPDEYVMRSRSGQRHCGACGTWQDEASFTATASKCRSCVSAYGKARRARAA